MKKPPANPAESIRQRLLNDARKRQEDPQFILQRYAGERFLYRLGQSEHRSQFVLKGAMLFALWGGARYRPTKDLDFAGYGSSDVEHVLARVREICLLDGAGDGMVFDVGTLRTEPIREDDAYGGLRLLFEGRLGKHQVRMQIDVGFGNAIEPGPKDVTYPALLDAPAPSIRAYPQEAVIAEKLHAMVDRGEINSRYKDFYDLHALASSFAFDGALVVRAIRATFDRRGTVIGAQLPVALTTKFYADSRRAEQWRAYVDRSNLPGVGLDFVQVGELVRSFLVEPYEALAGGRPLDSNWKPHGPWKKT